MKGWKNYKQLIRSWHKTLVKTWMLVLLLVIFSGLGAWGLHTNNVNMMSLREDVLASDRSGKNVDVPLNKLMNYSLRHMNASVEDLGLTHSYQRDADEAERVAKQNSKVQGRDSVTAKGQKHCEKSIGVDSSGYTTKIAQCVQDYVRQHGGSVGPAASKVVYPDKTLYYFSFASPRWSPDLAGFSILLALIAAIWLASRLIIRLIAVLIVRYRHR